jgi:predicted Abi (CAAX) family protease
MTTSKKERNFQRYQRATWIHPAAYPLDQPVDTTLYRPVAPWVGRLVLPPRGERDPEGGCHLELHHAPPAYAQWVGQTVRLRYSPNRLTQARTWAVTRHVIFNQRAKKMAADGLVLSERINRWRLVTPLESLAAGHPEDDIIVRLVEPVVVAETADGPLLLIDHEPVQISGRYMGLVTFVEPSAEVEHGWRVRHFNPQSRSFDGAESIVAVPPPILNENGTLPSTSAEINRSPLNEAGWYIYGAPGIDGRFLVQAWTPRALLRLEPQRVITGEEACWRYVRHEAWENVAARKGTITSVLCDPRAHNPATASAAWQEGDSALLLHVYSGIGGKQREPHARAFLYFGHFSFGVAEVIHEPLADELRFDITYYQIYTHNIDGLVAGALDWSRYMGDRQFGWAGLRPVCDILIKFDELNDPYQVSGQSYSVMRAIKSNLEQMAARYRIGDGRGATYVAAANNCSQDSSQAFYAAIVEIGELIETSQNLDEWAAANPTQAARLRRVQQVGRALRRKLVGGDARRPDWRYGVENLGIDENPLRNLARGLGTWRTLLPRKTSDTCARVFLQQGAALWVLGAYQVGGLDPNIEPIPVFTF